MKKNILIPLLALTMAGSTLLFTGCSSDVDITNINAEETTLSAEIEISNLSDGNIIIHPVIYDYNGNIMASVNVSISDDSGQLFTGTTDADGSLGSITLPCNTYLTCTVRSTSGTTLGESEMVFKLSDDYSSLTIYPPMVTSDSDALAECVLEIPTSKTDLRAAVFATEDGHLSFATLTPWSDAQNADIYAQGTEDVTSVSGENISEDAEGEDAEGEDTEDSENADGETEDTGESESESEDTDTDEGESED